MLTLAATVPTVSIGGDMPKLDAFQIQLPTEYGRAIVSAQINRILVALQRWSLQLSGIPWIEAKSVSIVEDVLFAASTNREVNHKLGRVPIGYMVLRAQGKTILFEDNALGDTRTKTTITLKTNAICTVVIMFW